MNAPAASVPALIHLRAGGASLVLDLDGGRLPRVLHWGSDLGEVGDHELEQLRLVQCPQVVSSQLDSVPPLAVVPEQTFGWLGTRVCCTDR